MERSRRSDSPTASASLLAVLVWFFSRPPPRYVRVAPVCISHPITVYLPCCIVTLVSDLNCDMYCTILNSLVATPIHGFTILILPVLFFLLYLQPTCFDCASSSPRRAISCLHGELICHVYCVVRSY